MPVLVDQYGALLAQGVDGKPGATGPAGPQGPQGPQGEPGPNDHLPYGPEYSYLSIKNGVPTWVLSNNEPNPPGPPSELMLGDTRDETFDNVNNYGSWGLNENLVFPPDPWDTYVRTLPTWETPGPQKMGIGGTSKDKLKVDCEFELTLLGGFDKLLAITFSLEYEGMDNSYGKYDNCSMRIECEHPQLTDITGQYKEKGQTGIQQRTLTHVFLPQRPDLGLIRFRLDVGKGTDWQGEVRHAFIQRWEYIDAAKYVLSRMTEVKQQLIPTTDIDLSRPTQD